MPKNRFNALRWAVILGCAVLLSLPVIRFGINFLTGITVIASIVIIVAAILFGPEPNSEGTQGRWIQHQLHALLSTQRNLLATTVFVWLGVVGFVAIAVYSRKVTPPPFRIEYITLNARAVDLLLAQRMEQIWEKPIPGEPFIVSNDVLRFLRQLQFSRTDARWNLDEPGSVGYRRGGTSQQQDSLTWRDLDQSASRQPDRTVGLRDDGTYLGQDYSEILQRVVPDRRWALAPLFDGGMQYYERELVSGHFPSLPFSRSVSIDELRLLMQVEVERLRTEVARNAHRGAFAYEYARSNLEHLAIYQNVLGSTLPTGLFSLSLNSNETHDDKSLDYSVPATGLHVAVVENISDAPQYIKAFGMRYDRNTGLRNSLRLSGTPEIIRFPPQWLKPGEIVIVPLHVELSVTGLSEYEGDPRKQRPPLAAAVERSKHQVFGINFDSHSISPTPSAVDRANVVDILSREPLEVRDAQYVIGPAAGNLFVVLEGRQHALREEVTGDLLVAYGGNVGSCPYIEVGGRDGTWKSAGTFLTAFISQRSEGWDTVNLPSFDGRILLIEKEAETTFIDYVGLVVERPGRADTTYSSTMPELAAADGRYLMLNPGDSIAIEIGRPPVSWYEPDQARLIGKGYFIPARRSVSAPLRSEKDQ